MEHALWFARALPRVWLSDGEKMRIEQATSAYGRVGLAIDSHLATSGSVRANLTLPSSWAARCDQPWPCVPPGGIVLRVRPPRRWRMRAVSIGGQPWDFNALDCTIRLNSTQINAPGVLAALQLVTVSFAPVD